MEKEVFPDLYNKMEKAYNVFINLKNKVEKKVKEGKKGLGLDGKKTEPRK